jgi:hypothetical protein
MNQLTMIDGLRVTLRGIRDEIQPLAVQAARLEADLAAVRSELEPWTQTDEPWARTRDPGGRPRTLSGGAAEDLRPGLDHHRPEIGAKHAQTLPYGSDEWVRVYFTLRNSIESFNGFAKDDNYEAIERGGRRRIRGLAAQMLLLSFQISHANKRKIDAWLDTLPAGSASRPRRAA